MMRKLEVNSFISFQREVVIQQYRSLHKCHNIYTGRCLLLEKLVLFR